MLPGLQLPFNQLCDILQLPLLHAALFTTLNIDCPRGVLLYGPPGVGKTFVVAMAARACCAELVTISGSDLLSPHIGQSERNLRDKFTEAQLLTISKSDKAVILFIDEIDVLAPARSSTLHNASSRVVAQLLTLMDGLHSDQTPRIVIVAATNRPNAIDPALRRPGRFDREIQILPPDVDTRELILQSLISAIPVSTTIHPFLKILAQATPGYVGADLAALVREACSTSLESSCHSDDQQLLTPDDLLAALKHVPPSLKKGYTLDNIKVTGWDDIAGLEVVKLRLQQAVIWPLCHQLTFQRLGLHSPRGVLMYGPPGCSKTTLAKVLASSLNASFFAVSGAEIYSAYVGEAERSVRLIFQRARQTTPSIIFLDELDALVGSRDGSSLDPTQERILSTLLNEMDGIEQSSNIIVVGATNRPDVIDKALIRPGRFDIMLYVEPPDKNAREQIFSIYTKNMPIHSQVNLSQLAEQTELCTGADIENICREAALCALRRQQQQNTISITDTITNADFTTSLRLIRPSLNPSILLHYDQLVQEYGRGT